MVDCIVFTRTCHQGFAAFNAQHLACEGGQWQGEVTQTTEPVNHALSGLHIEQTQSTRDQHTVDVRVDLREVGRLERHGDAKLRQGIRQRLTQSAVHQTHGVWAFGLEPPLHVVLGSKVAQSIHIAWAQRLHVTQHQSGHIITTGQFDLRQSLACIHAANELAQRHEHGIYMRGQDGALAHIGHVAALTLVETHQHFALFHHIAHRQTGAETITPSGALNGSQNGFWLDLAQVPQVVF